MLTKDEFQKLVAKQRYIANNRAERQRKNGDEIGAIMTMFINMTTEAVFTHAYMEAEKQENHSSGTQSTDNADKPE